MKVLTLVLLAVIQPKATSDGPASAELRALHKADQAARQFSGQPSMEVLHHMEAGDRAREERVRQLLRAGLLATGEDFDTCALIMQHGSEPDDFELARELAIIAYAKGKKGTLPALAQDRFLDTIGRPQRFGSQFDWNGKLKPVDTTSLARVTDDLRANFVQPSLKAQETGGLKAIQSELPKLVDRLRQRLCPKWQSEQAKRPEAKTLRRLHAHYASKDAHPEAIGHVLQLHHLGQIRTPVEFEQAAGVLMTSSEAETVLLANEYAALAFMWGRREAGRDFARSWDKFLTILGKGDRYGTVSRRKRVSALVEKELML